MTEITRRAFHALALLPAGAAALAAVPAAATGTTAENKGRGRPGDDFRSGLQDLLDLHGVPTDAYPHALNLFCDLGAWHAYGIPGATDTAQLGGFSGPLYLAEEFPWYLSRAFSVLALTDERTGATVDLSRDPAPELHSAPGILTQSYAVDGLRITLDLRYATNRTALIRATVRNEGSRPRTLRARWTGELLRHDTEPIRSAPSLVRTTTGVAVTFAEVRLHKDYLTTTQTRFEAVRSVPVDTVVDGDAYLQTALHATTVPPGHETHLAWTESYTFTDAEAAAAHGDAHAALSGPRHVVDRADERWRTYLRRALDGIAPDRRRAGAKAVQTVVSNWRSPAGALLSDGVTGAITAGTFATGLWAWDAWKTAVTVALFDPQLGASTAESVFDHQITAAHPTRPWDAGMIPDVVFYNDPEHGGKLWNERNSKPPLASWACWRVYERGADLAFLRRMYPKLLAHHDWWYRNRDHDRDGLAEYGSTLDPANDSTEERRAAASWESGMDNAPRFDDAGVVTTTDPHGRPIGYSLTQASVDLNSYLYAEKRALARISGALGRHREATAFDREADRVREDVRTRMYDPATGWFYDLGPEGRPVTSAGKGIEGVIPLWTGLASARQAAGVRAALTDPDQFATPLPLPTVSRQSPDFDPTEPAYWRGPVWFDQFLFAVSGLRAYGYHRDAAALTETALEHAEGLLGDAPIRENYNPLTGAGQKTTNFTWSATALLELLRGGITRND
ncbi:trehalase family glycosidase [Streptomyces sp. NPDC058382]|uniref:MGH1-like glycoside hydrolase domain-containing protein n=1 Tax=unclassified Streptomyces TaxID=2593676 RepID=UPI0036274C19